MARPWRERHADWNWGPERRDAYVLGRALAGQGMDHATIIEMLRHRFPAEAARAATLGIRWARDQSNPRGRLGQLPSRDRMTRIPANRPNAIPNTYRYHVIFRLANGEYWTAIVDSDKQLTYGAIRDRGIELFNALKRWYERVANEELTHRNWWRLIGAERR